MPIYYQLWTRSDIKTDFYDVGFSVKKNLKWRRSHGASRHASRMFIFMVISTSLNLVCVFMSREKVIFKHDVYVQFYASYCCCLWRTHKKSFLHQVHVCRVPPGLLISYQHFNFIPASVYGPLGHLQSHFSIRPSKDNLEL